MFFEDELNIKILDKNESLLGILHPNYVQLEEKNEEKGLRNIRITHPLTDDNNNDLTRYTDLLQHGNKVWREYTGDGNSCLYVLLEDKEIDPDTNLCSITAEEIATELSMIPPKRFNTTSPIPIDSTFLNIYFGDYFTIGIVVSGQTFKFSGTIGIMALLREIEKQTGCEFQFRYEYDQENNVIRRYLDFLEKKGKIINESIEIGYNTDNIKYEETEEDVAIAAAPVGAPSDSKDDANDNFHKARKAFEDLVITEGQQIPLWRAKDENGVLQDGPLAAAPYAKSAGQTYVASPASESGALYKEVYKKEKSSSKVPRTVLFESSEEDPYNLYWLCVEKINEKKQPQVKLESNVLDVCKIKGYEPTYYNVGDTVSLQLLGRYDRIQVRIIKTTKNPREPKNDKIELGNFVIDFFADYLHNFYPRSEPYQKI